MLRKYILPFDFFPCILQRLIIFVPKSCSRPYFCWGTFKTCIFLQNMHWKYQWVVVYLRTYICLLSTTRFSFSCSPLVYLSMKEGSWFGHGSDVREFHLKRTHNCVICKIGCWYLVMLADYRCLNQVNIPLPRC